MKFRRVMSFGGFTSAFRLKASRVDAQNYCVFEAKIGSQPPKKRVPWILTWKQNVWRNLRNSSWCHRGRLPELASVRHEKFRKLVSGRYVVGIQVWPSSFKHPLTFQTSVWKKQNAFFEFDEILHLCFVWKKTQKYPLISIDFSGFCLHPFGSTLDPLGIPNPPGFCSKSLRRCPCQALHCLTLPNQRCFICFCCLCFLGSDLLWNFM